MDSPLFWDGALFPPKFCFTLTVKSNISGRACGGREGSMSNACPAKRTSGSGDLVGIGGGEGLTNGLNGGVLMVEGRFSITTGRFAGRLCGPIKGREAVALMVTSV